MGANTSSYDPKVQALCADYQAGRPTPWTSGGYPDQRSSYSSPDGFGGQSGRSSYGSSHRGTPFGSTIPVRYSRDGAYGHHRGHPNQRSPMEISDQLPPMLHPSQQSRMPFPHQIDPLQHDPDHRLNSGAFHEPDYQQTIYREHPQAAQLHPLFAQQTDHRQHFPQEAHFHPYAMQQDGTAYVGPQHMQNGPRQHGVQHNPYEPMDRRIPRADTRLPPHPMQAHPLHQNRDRRYSRATDGSAYAGQSPEGGHRRQSFAY